MRSLMGPRLLCITLGLAVPLACDSNDDDNNRRAAPDAGTGDGNAMGGSGGMVGEAGSAGRGGSDAGSAGSGGTAGSGAQAGSGASAGSGGSAGSSACGDGIVDPGEDCDGDGLGRSGAVLYCDANCQFIAWNDLLPRPGTGPVVTGVLPPAIASDSGGFVAVSGARFDGTESVTVGGQAASIVSHTSTMLGVLVPAGTPNTWVDIVVTNAQGTSTWPQRLAYVLPTNFVTMPNDGAVGTLRSTLSAAAADDFVAFDLFFGEQNVDLTTELQIAQGQTIIGHGAQRTDVRQATPGARVFDVSGSGGVRIDGLRVTGGSLIGGDGAGIHVDGATLTVSRCLIDDNTTDSKGGGIYASGGATLSVSESLIFDNEARFGAGVYGSDIGGSGSISLINTTLSSNRSSENGGGINTNVAVELQFCTVKSNSAMVEGGGLHLATGGSIVLGNAVIADNTSAMFGPDLGGNYSSLSSLGYNLIRDAEGLVGVTGDRWGTSGTPQEAGLGPLLANGGPTRCHLPDGTAQLVMGAHPTAMQPFDQRGARRPTTGQLTVGAVEP